ncbi:hypothetical protein TVAG_157760 [Trichomonas vaginalis G3]|uniref:Importin N-terminal domain-containing protein n=1 Tax=Trichomonas vaginalis (strain ATCC PRA-98 / G3) TaxID=412133 RepID=A2FBB1_TRIV3|nr:importin beta family [Trichomonas vaginalis G3]EAX97791.1 hypothetical protein TVAG_157760 [Trichomonas vaginalis G3]KAI5552733.1 importin beta family [Trichomonas vaginalis G3]|eukprot:XP_001310721.1 hypothetical protein [Trichomonas vaginalis G3]
MSDIENLQALIQATLNAATVEQSTEQLGPILNDPTSADLFFKLYLLTSDNRIRHGSIVYAYKVVFKFWKAYDEQSKEDIKNYIMQILANEVYPYDVESVAQLVEIVYTQSEGKWPELVSYLLENALSKPLISSACFVKIALSLHSGFFEEAYEHLLNLIMNYLHSDKITIKLGGLALFGFFLAQIDEDEEDAAETTDLITDSQEPYQIINSMEQESLNYQPQDFSQLWSLVGDIAGSQKCKPDYLSTLMQTGFGFASNSDVSAQKRNIILTAISNGLHVLSQEEIGQILTVAIDIAANTIIEEQLLPVDQLSLFETILDSQSHSETYPMLVGQLLNALQSDSIEHQAAAMLVLRAIITTTPEFALKDSQLIVDCLKEALDKNEFPIIQHSALLVLETFDQTFASMNVYIPSLLPKIVPLLISQTNEVKSAAYKAILVLVERIDCKMPELFQMAVELYENVTEDDITNYFTLVAYSIDLSEDFPDEETEKLLNLLKEISQSENVTTISSSTLIMTALIKKDGELIEDIWPIIADNIQPCLEYESPDVISLMIEFLISIVEIFKGEEMNYVVNYLDYIFNLINNNEMDHRVRSTALEFICDVVHYSQSEEITNKFGQQTIEILMNFLKEKNDFQIESVEGFRRLARDLDENTRKEAFDHLLEIVNQDVTTNFVTKSLFCLSKLISKSNGDEHMVNEGMNLLNNIINGNIELLGQIPLIETDTTIGLFPSVCQLIASLVSNRAPISDEITVFLLEWMKRDSEIDKCKAIGALSDIVLNNELNNELKEQIIQNVSNEMEESEDPAMQENIVHIFNVFITQNQEVANLVYQTIEKLKKWWDVALQNKSGYNDLIMNLSGLFLVLGILIPEFPDNVLISVIEQFPHEDEELTAAMCGNIGVLLDYRQNISASLLRALALGFGRLFSYDNKHLQNMGVVGELYDTMIQVFRHILSLDPQAVPIIRQMCSSTKTKLNRINKIMQ